MFLLASHSRPCPAPRAWSWPSSPCPRLAVRPGRVKPCEAESSSGSTQLVNPQQVEARARWAGGAAAGQPGPRTKEGKESAGTPPRPAGPHLPAWGGGSGGKRMRPPQHAAAGVQSALPGNGCRGPRRTHPLTHLPHSPMVPSFPLLVLSWDQKLGRFSRAW